MSAPDDKWVWFDQPDPQENKPIADVSLVSPDAAGAPVEDLAGKDLKVLLWGPVSIPPPDAPLEPINALPWPEPPASPLVPLALPAARGASSGPAATVPSEQASLDSVRGGPSENKPESAAASVEAAGKTHAAGKPAQPGHPVRTGPTEHKPEPASAPTEPAGQTERDPPNPSAPPDTVVAGPPDKALPGPEPASTASRESKPAGAKAAPPAPETPDKPAPPAARPVQPPASATPRVILPTARVAPSRSELRPALLSPAAPKAAPSAAEVKAAPSSDPPRKSSAPMKAILLHLEGKLEEAIQELTAGLDGGENPIEIKAALGNMLYEAGRVEQAAARYREVLAEEPQHPGIHYKLGVCLHQLGRLAEALEEFGRAAELSSADWEARLAIGVVLLEMSRPSEALPRFEECVEARPQDVSGLIGKGIAFEQLGRIIEAEAAFRSALEMEPANAGARHHLLGICVARNAAVEARKLASETLEVDPSSRPALEALATLEMEAGNHLPTEGFCERLVKVVPEFFEAWFNLGVCRLALQNFSGAAQAFGEAARLRPDHGPSALAHARSAKESGDAAGARKILESAIERLPGEARLTGLLAELVLDAGDLEGAEKLLIRLQPGAFPKGGAEIFEFRFGRLLLDRGDYSGAGRVFEACLKRRPEWLEAKLNLGLAWWRAGNREEAKKLLTALLSAQPNQTEALYALAYLDIESEDYGGALDVLLKLAANGERSVELFYNTGLLLQHFDMLEDALGNYREALKEQPDLAEALERMGQVASALGRGEEAQEYWKLAKQMPPEQKLAPSRR